MALTLAESAKLSLDMLRRGVIETIIDEGPIFDYLPFITVEGNSYKYNQENTLPGAAFYAVNAVITEATADFTQKTVNLAILVRDADVDNFIQRTRGNINDQMGVQTALAAKSVARKFEDTVIVGDVSVDSNSFDGLRILAVAAQELTMGANGAALTLAKLDETIDLVFPGKPDILLMSRRSRRKLKALLTASTHYVESGETSFGRMVMFYDGIPVIASSFQPNDETEGTETAASSIYGIKFGEDVGVFGVQNGDIEVVNIGQLETKDGSRVRIRWYTGLGLAQNKGLARLRGISAA